VYGDAEVGGHAEVAGKARIGGTAKILEGYWNGSEGEVLGGTWRSPEEYLASLRSNPVALAISKKNRNSKMRRRRKNPRYSQEDKNRFRDYIKTRAMNAYGDAVDEEKLDNRIENELLWRLERNYDIADMDELRHAYDDVTAYHEDIFYSSGPRSMSRRPVRDRSDRNPRLRRRNPELRDLSYNQLINLLEKNENLEEKIEKELERRDVRSADSRRPRTSPQGIMDQRDIIQAYEDEDAFEAELSRTIDYIGPMQNPRRIRRRRRR
jgi:hypothetical protein